MFTSVLPPPDNPINVPPNKFKVEEGLDPSPFVAVNMDNVPAFSVVVPLNELLFAPEIVSVPAF